MTNDDKLAKFAEDSIIREEAHEAFKKAKKRIDVGNQQLANSVRVQEIDALQEQISERYQRLLNKPINESRKAREELSLQLQSLQSERDKLAPPQQAEHKKPDHISNVKTILK